MKLSKNALTLLKARYLLKNNHGIPVETPEELFRRVAKVIASSEKNYGGDILTWENRFFEAMSNLMFLPNTPVLINAGKDLGQLAACFVLPVDDSMTGIFDTLKNAALILQSGGGTGFSFSHIRPRTDIVKSTGGIASGPVSFMRIYNTATEVIKQGGARRGANMGILRVDHPDILEFIRIKRQDNELSNFNISIAVTDAFMSSVLNNMTYSLINPRDGNITGELSAGKVFEEIVDSAWTTGDPGLVFIDRVNRDNPTPHLGLIESTNPCGEQPLLPYEACVLGSINLSKVVHRTKAGHKHDNQLHSHFDINWDLLSELVSLGVRFLDNTIDANKYPVQEVEKMHRGNRKIGLGIMGWADMLIKLGIEYNSFEAFSLARKVMSFIKKSSRKASSELAIERGVFPNFRGSIFDDLEFEFRAGLRNATTTTIAPTGSLSIIAGCSSGIEPLFGISYERQVLDKKLKEVHPLFLDAAKKGGFYTPELMNKIESHGSLKGINEVPKHFKKLYITAHEIPPEDHIEMQASFQQFTDNAVSKTINLRHSSKKHDVSRAFLLAFEKGCKGITVFRYGSKQGTLIKTNDSF